MKDSNPQAVASDMASGCDWLYFAQLESTSVFSGDDLVATALLLIEVWGEICQQIKAEQCQLRSHLRESDSIRALLTLNSAN